MREENQLKIICRILENYHQDQLLNRYLKDFYKTHPQMGSRDRRQASDFIYNYFRLGKALGDLRMIERLTIANYLCSNSGNPLLTYCIEKFSLLEQPSKELSLKEKMDNISKHYPAFLVEKIFPFLKHLSGQIEKDSFLKSFLSQPKLWIRVRSGCMENVHKEFDEKNILFEKDDQNPNAWSLVNSVSLENSDSFRRGFFEIQDWSSQQTIRFMNPAKGETWWDACCGSGGKSLMLKDAEPTIKSIASDNRSSTLKNLEERFSKAGITDYKIFQSDLTDQNSLIEIHGQELHILADVPCSGSGTWARTPEWLTRFNENTIAQHVAVQRKMIHNLSIILPKVKKLVYITCSVFKEENEENVDWFVANFSLVLNEAAYIKGFSKHADTMFIAILTRK